MEARRARLALEIAALDAALDSAAQNTVVAESHENPVLVDYSYLAKNAGRYTDDLPTGPPGSFLRLGAANFRREIAELRKILGASSTAEDDDTMTEEAKAVRQLIGQLTLSNDAIWKRERARPQVRAPWVIKGPYFALCLLLDVMFEGQPISRFFFLENVARMPYLSYVCMLDLYESLGWWRRGAGVKRVHFSEEWNEFHHLLIMESLGGDQNWRTRFLAGHASIAYFWVLVFLWILSPTLAYNFSELIEAHAVDTYEQFADENQSVLSRIPPPPIAISYYVGEDMYLYDEFQTERPAGSRRPVINNLHDVFVAIAGDEGEHVRTMAACQDKTQLVRSANIEAALAVTTGVAVVADRALKGLAELDEVPASIDSLVTLAQAYAETGGLSSLVDLLSKLIPFIGG